MGILVSIKDFVYKYDQRLYFFLVALIAFLQIYLHIEADFCLPIPWPDESHFLWQAIAFKDSFTLFSSELNPERSILWMPPGFMIISALVMKLIGSSLAVARSISLIFQIGSLILTSLIFYQLPYRILSVIGLGFVFLNTPMTAMGNIARPEAMLLFCLLLGLFLIQRQKRAVSLSIVLLTPLIHPSGIIFCGVAILWLIYDRRFSDRQFMYRIHDLYLPLFVSICWLTYIFYISQHWSSFVADMTFQYDRKAARDLLGILLTVENTIFLVTVVLAQIYAIVKRKPIALLFLFSLPAWLMMKLGNEMWYFAIYALGYLFFSLLIVHTGYSIISLFRFTKKRTASAFVFGLIIATVMSLNLRSETIIPIFKYPSSVKFHEMGYSTDLEYFSDIDLFEIGKLIDSITTIKDDPLIQFIPRADAFLIEDKLGGKYRVSHPLFCEQDADYYIFHKSRYIPSWWKGFVDVDLKAIGYDSLDNNSLFHSRDSTESWYCLSLARSNIIE